MPTASTPYLQPSADLQRYVEANILPRYARFDAAHRLDHVRCVIDQSLQLVAAVNASPDYRDADGSKTIVSADMAYAIAAYHDTGLCDGRDEHHRVSARIIRDDEALRRWFSADEIEVRADAAEDHRASSKSEPRTIYGRIVAEADRVIDAATIIRRTVQFGLDHYPELCRAEHFSRAAEHLREKYGRGGYLRLWMPESANAARLEALRCVIDDAEQLGQAIAREWQALVGD